MTYDDGARRISPPPDLPRWRVHVEVEGEHPEMLAFRGGLDDRLRELPPWRGAVVTVQVGLVALTFSAFGDDYEEAMLDAKAVLHDFRVPGGSMSIELSSPEQIDRRRKSQLPMLLGVKEVARICGLTKQRISQLARDEAASFPRPIAWVEATPLWLGDEVAEWREARGASRR